MDLADSGRAELLEPVDLCVDISRVDVDVDAAGPLVETSDEDAEVLAGDLAPDTRGSARCESAVGLSRATRT
jgi:hypothetical protein